MQPWTNRNGYAKHTYTKLMLFALNTTVPQYQAIRMNSIWDPDFTGVGTVASGHTQMSNMFARNQVVKSYMTIKWWPYFSVPAGAWVWGDYWRTEDMPYAPPTDVQVLNERRGLTGLSLVNFDAGSTGSKTPQGQGFRYMKAKFNLAKESRKNGWTNVQTSNDYNANPTRELLFYFNTMPVLAAAPDQMLYALVRITYYVKWMAGRPKNTPG